MCDPILSMISITIGLIFIVRSILSPTEDPLKEMDEEEQAFEDYIFSVREGVASDCGSFMMVELPDGAELSIERKHVSSWPGSPTRATARKHYYYLILYKDKNNSTVRCRAVNLDQAKQIFTDALYRGSLKD